MVNGGWWIEVGGRRLLIIPRPRGGDWLVDDLKALRRDGVDVLVCTLTQREMVELDLTGEAALAEATGLTWYWFPIEDRGVPAGRAHLHDLVSRLVAELDGGRTVAVHCRQGIGRSSLVAAAVLIRGDMPPTEVWQRIEAARGRPVPDTPEQRAWLQSHSADT
jgi:protein-tyrosine phosphatase